MTDEEAPKVNVPPFDTPTQASDVESESCPVCGKEFAHVSDAPVTVHKSGGDICITSFGVIFFH